MRIESRKCLAHAKLLQLRQTLCNTREPSSVHGVQTRIKKYQDLEHKYLGLFRRTTWEKLRKESKLIE